MKPSWTSSTVIANELRLNERHVKNVVDLLRNDHTIPFIARYRKENTDNMDVKSLYQIKEKLSSLDNVVKKSEKSLKHIDSLGCLTPELKAGILSCTSLSTLDCLTAAYKPGSKKSRAEKAKELGLEDVAIRILNGWTSYNLSSYIKNQSGLKTVSDITSGIIDIIVEKIRNSKEVLEACERTSTNIGNIVECTESKSKANTSNQKEKFDQYYSFKRDVGSIRPFQIMAINRGESIKALSVKISLSEQSQKFIRYKCGFVVKAIADHNIKLKAIEEACSRLVFPLICRKIRSMLSDTATKSSIEVFADNLRSLLLLKPVKNVTVLAVDPGFSHGCKIAILDSLGSVLKTDTIFLKNNKPTFMYSDELKIKDYFSKYKWDVIAIGNGTGCRETEKAISDLIKQNSNWRQVKYTIVDERGASIYSVTKLAETEFPNLESNVRSAISIGRRLQNPLSEYVKIEPQHLGVGQYQHDISQKKLAEKLDDIVVECVSFTGVDINSCQEYILERIAGLNKTRAKAIVEYRNKNGKFTSREEIKQIKGIGPKSYQQSVGFLRIYHDDGETVDEQSSGSETDVDIPLAERLTRKRKGKSVRTKRKTRKTHVCFMDQTSIHPESYEAAFKLFKTFKLSQCDIGKLSFINRIKSLPIDDVVNTLSCSKIFAEGLLESLSHPIDHDYRNNFGAPIFKESVVNIDYVAVGSELIGRISNVAQFGAFVDIGLNKDGLIHISNMKGFEIRLGQQVKVVVCRKDQKGIGLKLISII